MTIDAEGQPTKAGLVDVSLADVEALLRAIDAGRLPCPLEVVTLRAEGFGRLVSALGSIIGLDRAGVCAVLTAVIAERTERGAPSIELVWTGPETSIASARDTAVVVRELFAHAERSVLVAGFRFDHGAELLLPLFEGMRDRGVRASIFVDIPERARDATRVEALVQATSDQFLIDNWPFGAPRPELYYDPRSAAPGSTASLHAKCVVVDGVRALVTSANFTDRGQTRNVEAGLLVTSTETAERLETQWWSLVRAGLLRRML